VMLADETGPVRRICRDRQIDWFVGRFCLRIEQISQEITTER
jgi:hypothetical protein